MTQPVNQPVSASSALTPFDFNALRLATKRLALLAREEDLGRGDITSQLVVNQGRGRFQILAKQAGVFAGREIVSTVLDVYEGAFELRWTKAGTDGTSLGDTPVPVAEIEGSVAQVLTVERVLLNFLQRLCGVATLTRRFVDAVSHTGAASGTGADGRTDAGTGAEILDTRKTTPGWRLLEKYAVRCGGGRNHRMGLYDAILIKDNHLAAYSHDRAGAGVFEMLNHAPALDPPASFVEVEADTLTQVEQFLSVVGINVILLDNFVLDDLRRAVELRDARNLRGKVKLEASGGVTLDTVRDIAETGVDYISVGAITHSATALDLSLERVD